MDKRWIQEGDIHILLYTPYYDEEEFARMMLDWLGNEIGAVIYDEED